MRTRLSFFACLVALVAALGLSVVPANAAPAPRVPQIPGLEALAWGGTGIEGRLLSGSSRLAAASGTGGTAVGVRFPMSLARLLATFGAMGSDAERAHRRLRRLVRLDGLDEYVHVGRLRGRRFTVTAISDQACATVRRRPQRLAPVGPCVPADRRASLTPLQDSANLLLVLARDVFESATRTTAVRAIYNPVLLRFMARLIAPRGVRVSAVNDTDHDGLDDDGRTAFHANGTTVCATLPSSAKTSGRVTFGSCQRLAPRRVEIHERARAVFREMKYGADIGASMKADSPAERAQYAADLAPALSSHPEAKARAMGDRVQFRARVNDKLRFACYRVSPDGDPARYSRTGRPGTWRLGRCR